MWVRWPWRLFALASLACLIACVWFSLPAQQHGDPLASGRAALAGGGVVIFAICALVMFLT